ncbi:MAG: sialidase family protein [Bryobacteraceae bacterium]
MNVRSLILLMAWPLVAADLEHIVVHRDDLHYYITPWMTRLQNGDLVLTAREAHRRRREFISHADPTARGILLRSRDGGRTWGDKTLVDDETYRFSQTEDVPVTQLSDGTLLLNLYSWAVTPLPVNFRLHERQKTPYTITFEGTSFLRSTDNGKTWGPREPLTVPGLPLVGSRVPTLETPSGELLIPVYGQLSSRGPYVAWVIRSQDKGKTWGQPAELANDPAVSFAEPALLRLRNGNLISMIRTEGYLYQTMSTDGGRTFSKTKKTDIWGYPAFLMELRDGRVLCIYGYRRKPFGLRYAISRDGGVTWDPGTEKILRDDGGTSDLGYPSAVEFEDGRVFVVYWFNQEKPGEAASEVRYLAGTFFRP